MVLSMERWKGKVAVVSGAGGGVGGAVVKQLLEHDLKVVAIDRRPDSLEELSQKTPINKGKLFNFAIDVTQDEEVEKLFKKISEEVGLLHILVNCAGIIQGTSLVDGNTQMWRKTLEVNVIGLSIMTREAIKVMRGNNIDGHIVHMCSITGHIISNIPGLNMYGASKHAVKALTETLRQEFNRLELKIKISSISPGKIQTDILKNNNIEIKQPISKAELKPDDVADAVLYVLATPPHVQVHDVIVKPIGELF